MKLLITPNIDRLLAQNQQSAQVCLQQYINSLKTVSVRKNGQIIELQNNHLVRAQLDSALDNLDINNMLDPNMPNFGGMEVMATIKRDLSVEIETMLAIQKN